MDSPTEQFRAYSPHWAWLRENFTLPSVLAMASVISGAAYYCISLSNEVQAESREIGQVSKDISDVKGIVQPLSGSLADIARGQRDQGERLSRLEEDYDVAYREAGKPIKRKR
jgi:hypothetical protein